VLAKAGLFAQKSHLTAHSPAPSGASHVGTPPLQSIELLEGEHQDRHHPAHHLGFCFSIFFIEPLNNIRVGKVGLGFWFAQQGSIIVFVILIFIYAKWMDRLDRKHKLED